MAGKNRFLVVMAHNLTPGLEAIIVRVAQRKGFAITSLRWTIPKRP